MYTEVNSIKLAPVVLISIMTLAVASGLCFAVTSGVAQQIESVLSKGNIEINWSSTTLALYEPLQADPIDGGKPG